jgi:hypothetical protein
MACCTAGKTARRLCLSAACLLLPILANAQAPQSVPANQPLVGQFTPSSEGAPATGFRCYVNETLIQELPASGRTCQFPGLIPGSHTLAVSGFNAFGEGPKASVPVMAGTAPNAPMEFLIRASVATDGTVTLRLESPR